MLKCLAILAVLWLSFTCVLRTAAETQKKISGSTGSAQTTQTDKRGTPETPHVVNARTIYGDKEAAEETQKVAEQNRLNRWTILLTAVIAVCAFLQFWAIVGQIVVYRGQSKLMAESLKEIRIQAGQMGTQTGILEKSVAAAQASAIAAQTGVDVIINKERARITVAITGMKIEKDTIAEVYFTLTCFGPTPAFVKDFWIGCETTESLNYVAPKTRMPISLPSPLNASVLSKSIWVMDKLQFEPQDIENLNEGRLFIQVSGFVTYRDVFGVRDRETKFCVICKATDYIGLDGRKTKMWLKNGPEEANSET